MPISEASAKLRTDGPHDEGADLDWPVWAGLIPLRFSRGDPVAEPGLSERFDLPLPSA
jgi:hypothetical protein